MAHVFNQSAELCLKEKQTFSAIKTFVEELYNVFGQPGVIEPLTLYHRLLYHVKEQDSVIIRNKIFEGFNNFFKDYPLERLSTIDDKVVIRYGTKETISIPIGKYLTSGKKDIVQIIADHLLTIYALLEQDDAKVDQLLTRVENLKTDEGNETQAVDQIYSELQKLLVNIDLTNPGPSLMMMFQGGEMQNLIEKFQNCMGDGNLNSEKLLSEFMKKSMSTLSSLGAVRRDTQQQQQQVIPKHIQDKVEKDLK